MLRIYLPPKPEALQTDDDQLYASYAQGKCDCQPSRAKQCRRKPKPVVFLDNDGRVEITYMCKLSTLELFADEDTAFIFDNGEWGPLK